MPADFKIRGILLPVPAWIRAFLGMLKWSLYLVLAVLVGGSWMMYAKKGSDLRSLNQQISQLEEIGDPDEKLPSIQSHLHNLEGERTFSGILLTFLSAGLAAVFVVIYALPFFAHRVSQSVYDSAEMVEKDFMRDARSLVAQGDYEGAIEAFKVAADAEPMNRVPWVEIIKIYKENLHDAAAAIQTTRQAIESHEWQPNDAAYFLFRLAELHDEVDGDRAAAVAILNQVIEQFPSTRHSANAAHKLREWSATGGAGKVVAAERDLAAEEEEYLARMRQGSTNPPA